MQSRVKRKALILGRKMKFLLEMRSMQGMQYLLLDRMHVRFVSQPAPLKRKEFPGFKKNSYIVFIPF